MTLPKIVNGDSGSVSRTKINNAFDVIDALSGSSGSAGNNGSSGTSGSSGASGTSGSSGISGSSGTSGADGSSGSSGTTGASGSSGTSGADGSSGSSGTTGAPGSSGSSGTSGADGSSGSSGTTGASGSSGTSGADGSSGSSGTTGANGSSGTSGANGSSGSSGLSGLGDIRYDATGNRLYANNISQTFTNSVAIGVFGLTVSNFDPTGKKIFLGNNQNLNNINAGNKIIIGNDNTGSITGTNMIAIGNNNSYSANNRGIYIGNNSAFFEDSQIHIGNDVQMQGSFLTIGNAIRSGNYSHWIALGQDLDGNGGGSIQIGYLLRHYFAQMILMGQLQRNSNSGESLASTGAIMISLNPTQVLNSPSIVSFANNAGEGSTYANINNSPWSFVANSVSAKGMTAGTASVYIGNFTTKANDDAPVIGANTQFTVMLGSHNSRLQGNNSRSTLINSPSSQIATGITNSALINRPGFTASASNTVYMPNIDTTGYSINGVAGWTGTFSTGDSRVATITNGIITNVA